MARLQVHAACSAQKLLQSGARLIATPLVIATRSLSASVYVSHTPVFGVNAMDLETRGASLFFPAYVHVARWIANDVEARKRKRANTFRQGHLLKIAFVAWKGNTEFVPALRSSSSSEEGNDEEWSEDTA